MFGAEGQGRGLHELHDLSIEGVLFLLHRKLSERRQIWRKDPPNAHPPLTPSINNQVSKQGVPDLIPILDQIVELGKDGVLCMYAYRCEM